MWPASEIRLTNLKFETRDIFSSTKKILFNNNKVLTIRVIHLNLVFDSSLFLPLLAHF